MASVYNINKGINRSIEFKGIRAQYIGYLAVGMLLLFLLFAILYVLGLSVWFCVGTIGALGILLYLVVIRLSHRFGRHGLLKYLAKKALPKYLWFSSRKLFTHLKQQT